MRDAARPGRRRSTTEHRAPVGREDPQGTPLWQLQHYCGGTLIAEDWVLTAAHCIDEDMVKAGYRVRLGAQRHLEGQWHETYKIDRIVRHSQYGSKICPRPAQHVRERHRTDPHRRGPPAGPRDPRECARSRCSKERSPAGAEVTGTGWGKTEAVEGHAPSAVLMKVDLRVMDNGAASNRPDTARRRIHANVICASIPSARPARATAAARSS